MRKEINRQKIQDHAIHLSEHFPHVLLSWATGVGKSLAAIKIIDNDIRKSQELNGDWNIWYIICAERQHISNWKDEFIKHGYEKLIDLEYVKIFCYQSLHKYADKKVNIVLDEAHMVTDLRLDILQQIKGDKIISLTASLESSRAKQLKSLRDYEEYNITTDKAIKAGILEPPIIVKCEIELYHDLRKAYDSYSTQIDSILHQIALVTEKLSPVTFDKPVPLKPYEKSLLENELRLLRAKELKERVKRKSLVSNIKTSTIRILQKNIESWNKKYIIFGGTGAQCRKLYENSANCVLINSDKPTKQNLIDLTYFNNDTVIPGGSIRGIIANKMLRQGTNLEGIEMGVISQLDSKELSFIQMMGRIFRSKTPVLFVFVAKDTVDEVYWDNCSKGLDPSYILSYNEYISKYHG